jgi:hypothetical protein
MLPKTDSSSSAASVSISDHTSGVSCDFCSDKVGSVRRVALHGDYERLRTKHNAQYACPSCFEKKDRQRMGLDRL